MGTSRKSTPTPSRPITNHFRAKKLRQRKATMGDKGVKLRGQVIDKPKEQMWMLKSESDLEEYKYTCEPGHMEWTPLNSNLTMQGIKVQVNRPIPETTISNLANSHEDTLLLLDLMRHKRQQEGQKKRENMIREMALQQKQKKEAERSRSMGTCHLSWNCKTAASTTGGI